jgi:hypothetical protein
MTLSLGRSLSIYMPKGGTTEVNYVIHMYAYHFPTMMYQWLHVEGSRGMPRRLDGIFRCSNDAIAADIGANHAAVAPHDDGID